MIGPAQHVVHVYDSDDGESVDYEEVLTFNMVVKHTGMHFIFCHALSVQVQKHYLSKLMSWSRLQDH